MRRRAGVAAVAGAALLIAAAVPAAHGASRTATFSGWAAQTAAFAGERLLVFETAPVVVDPRNFNDAPAGAQRFVYYRAELRAAALTRSRLLFNGTFASVNVIRTSTGAMAPGILTVAPGGDYVLAPTATRFPTPVVWCCDDDEAEVAVESDSRQEAGRATAAAIDPAGRVRMLTVDLAGVARLVAIDPVGLGINRSEVVVPVATRPALATMGPGELIWVDPSAPTVLRRAPVSDAGLGAVSETTLPGPALRVQAGGATVAVLVRVGANRRVVRVDGGGAARMVWSGRRTPRFAAGNGTVVVADGRRVSSQRAGGRLRPLARAAGPVTALAADGNRAAWLTQGLRKRQRVTVARVAAVPR